MLSILSPSNLWLFVSNFTTLNHNKLRKLYKGACKKRESEKHDKKEVSTNCF